MATNQAVARSNRARRAKKRFKIKGLADFQIANPFLFPTVFRHLLFRVLPLSAWGPGRCPGWSLFRHLPAVRSARRLGSTAFARRGPPCFFFAVAASSRSTIRTRNTGVTENLVWNRGGFGAGGLCDTGPWPPRSRETAPVWMLWLAQTR